MPSHQEVECVGSPLPATSSSLSVSAIFVSHKSSMTRQPCASPNTRTMKAPSSAPPQRVAVAPEKYST